MDEEDYSRYFTDEAELSNYNTSTPSDYSRYFTDEAEQSNYNTSAPSGLTRSYAAPSDQNYAAPFDMSTYQDPEITQYIRQASGGDPESAMYADFQKMMQDRQVVGQGNQTAPGGDQPTKLSPFDAQTEFDPNSEQAKKYLLDKTNLLKGIQAVLPGAKKQIDASQMTKKDMLSFLMPMLLAMIAKNQGGGSSRSPAQDATQPKIPTLTASREMTPYVAPSEKGYTRPGAGGKKYFSDVQYKADGGEIQSQPFSPGPTTYKNPYSPPDPVIATQTTYKAAGGGIGDLGGYSDGGRLLKGPGDGVSDSIPAKIGQSRPARLSDGEFVIPARIVSELGNGSTEAGAKKLYAMMDRVKKARNHKNIAANTKADKHLPA